MSIEEVRRTLFAARDAIANAPAAEAKLRWEEVPIEQAGEALGAVMTQLAGLHAQTEVALGLSAEVKDGYTAGLTKLYEAAQGTDSHLASLMMGTAEVVGSLAAQPVRIGGELGTIYDQIAEHLGSLQLLVDAAVNMRNAAANACGGADATAQVLTMLIEEHANSFLFLEE